MEQNFYAYREGSAMELNGKIRTAMELAYPALALTIMLSLLLGSL
jgi:hypothetical protein